MTFGVGFGALNTGNNLLYLVLSLMLAFLVLSGILSESALRGIRVRRTLPREIFAEAANRVYLEVRNDQLRAPAFAVAVEDESTATACSDGVAPVSQIGRVFVLHLGPGATEHRSYRLRPLRRGPLVFHRFRVSTRFPFGLFLKSKVIEAPERALAYPAVDPIRIAPGGRAQREWGDRDHPSPSGGAEVSGLRDYAAGDSPRRIHWRSSARRRQLVVREIEDDVSLEREVRLRTRSVASEGFESAVRRAASEVVAALQAGLRVSLRTDEVTLPPGSSARHRAEMLSLLARVQPDAGAAA